MAAEMKVVQSGEEEEAASNQVDGSIESVLFGDGVLRDGLDAYARDIGLAPEDYQNKALLRKAIYDKQVEMQVKAAMTEQAAQRRKEDEHYRRRKEDEHLKLAALDNLGTWVRVRARVRITP